MPSLTCAAKNGICSYVSHARRKSSKPVLLSLLLSATSDSAPASNYLADSRIYRLCTSQSATHTTLKCCMESCLSFVPPNPQPLLVCSTATAVCS